MVTFGNILSNKKELAMKQMDMFNMLDEKTLDKVIKHIEELYIDNPKGRVMRQVAEVIVEDLKGWLK